MGYTFYAEDESFGTATGDNVDAGGGYSYFDDPPSSYQNLTITSSDDDSDPRLFEPGEVYSITYDGPDGPVAFEGTVLRSDPFSENAGAVVFEGATADGETVQVVWAPNFDLQQWYEDSVASGRQPAFYNTDQSAASYGYACFTKTVLIETPRGEVPIAEIKAGDLVLTRDRGAQPVLWHATSRVPSIGRAAAVHVDPATFGGRRWLGLSAQHRVLLSGPMVELYCGHEEVLAPVKALVDGVRVTRRSEGLMTYHHLLLEHHELIKADGVWCESMFLGDQLAETLGPEAREDFRRTLGIGYPAAPVMSAARPFISVQETRIIRPAFGLGPKDSSAPMPSFLIAA